MAERALIVDLDGCLADCTARLERAKKPDGKMDWGVFYDRMEEDVFVPAVHSLVEMFRKTGHTILVLSGRPESYRGVTDQWLCDNKVEFDYSFFRPNDDRRPAPVFKKSMYEHRIKGNWDVRCAIDDDERIVKMYMEELGIPCILPGGLGHIQAAFSTLDEEAVLKIADDVATNHITMEILNLSDTSGCPENTKIGWLRSYSINLARDVAKRIRA